VNPSSRAAAEPGAQSVGRRSTPSAARTEGAKSDAISGLKREIASLAARDAWVFSDVAGRRSNTFSR